MKRISAVPVTVLLVLTLLGTARADEVTDWNQHMSQAIFTAKTNAVATGRVVAIVHAAIFDALNGIDNAYTPIHVPPAAPAGASRRAAVIQAGYATLLALYPAQKSALDTERTNSLIALLGEDSTSVDNGIAWGQSVADAILAWRSTDGFAPPPPPFLGGTDPGQWRPTPPALLPGILPQLAIMTPFVINAHDQFRPAGPPALKSWRYAFDFQEVKTLGSLTSTLRTPYQTEAAKFWAGNTDLFWNRIALTMAAQRHTTLMQNARLFALINVALCDAAIGCWDAKYFYVFWRPITAIQLADTDHNPLTAPDTTWKPLITTPAFPEYPSGHATASPAAAVVLQSFFGDSGTFTLDSEALPGVLHTFPSFAAAADEAFFARIWGGIHFRSACRDGHTLGVAIGNYVFSHGLLPR